MRTRLCGFTAILWTLTFVTPAAATTITVGQAGGYNYSTIQAGIDAAVHGDTILVHPATYFENIHFRGKNIILRSTDPTDPAIVDTTIIDASYSGAVVTFAGTEATSCVLTGFTIQRGKKGGVVGGTWGSQTSALIERNVVKKNYAGERELGGGLAFCNGTIRHTTVTENSSVVGGGLYDCDGTIEHNSISANRATAGGGLMNCDGTIENNSIAGNWARVFAR